VTRASDAGPDSARLDLGEVLESLRGRLDAAKVYLRIDDLIERQGELEKIIGEPDLWSDADQARKVTSEYGRIRDDIEGLRALETQLGDAEALHLLAVEEGGNDLADLEAGLTEVAATVARALDELELRSLFSGEHDERDAVAEIHAGAGGTDAQDWAEMMLRMYLRWAERRGFAVEVDEVSEGGEAGILSATFIVRGRYAYGLLAAERGVHRLVRMSPFDSQHRRQTSFASLDVAPFLEDLSEEVEIDEKELRVDTYRSSGAGGQHVNVTDSAVRITHLPTGIVTSCQNERSQHQNKAKALHTLAERQRAERRKELETISGPLSDVAWGSQIRSYVLAPYQLVKDLRSGHETGNVEAVLDGDLYDFMIAFLRFRREHEGS